MAPIAVDGLGVDDVTIDGDVVDEITMDGDVVYQASAIPDRLIDDFESQSLSDYSGPTSGYSADTNSPVLEGDASLKTDGDPGNENIIYLTDNERTPNAGEEFSVFIRSEDDDIPCLVFAYDPSSGNFYSTQYLPGENEIWINKDRHDGAGTISSASIPTAPIQEYVEMFVQWESNGDISVEVYTLDGFDPEDPQNHRSDLLGSTNVNDSDYTSGDVGFMIARYTSGSSWDYAAIWGDVGTT